MTQLLQCSSYSYVPFGPFSVFSLGIFVCFYYLIQFILCFFVFLVFFLLFFCAVSTSVSDCLERLVSEMTYYVSSGT